MMSGQAIESCLNIGREALVLFAEILASGSRSRSEIAERALAESDALTCLLDEAPDDYAARIHELLDRYATFMRAVAN